jgi:hypothetical protein
MTDVMKFAQVTVRAADLADRAEAAGALVAASALREVARDVEEWIVRVAPPDGVGWQRRAGARPSRS